jgi:microspherule protein 1
VHRGIKFSCHFTSTEVNSRWNALLYNATISKLALQAIRNLHPEIVLQVQCKTLLSNAETVLLSAIKSNTHPAPTLKDFEEMLKKNPNVFHCARTSRCLQQHWQSLKQYTLLPGKSAKSITNWLKYFLNYVSEKLFKFIIEYQTNISFQKQNTGSHSLI